jgi:hypothetical protein
MQRADWNGKIVGIAPASRKQRRIFLAQNWLTELLGHIRGGLPFDLCLHPRPKLVSSRNSQVRRRPVLARRSRVK